MLFPGNALPSGPQTCFGAEKGLLGVKVGKYFKKIFQSGSIDFLFLSLYI
jgi:hypothetical protein